MKGKKNQDVVDFALKARAMGMSYGQLQQMETISLIRSGKIGQNNKKKGKKK